MFQELVAQRGSLLEPLYKVLSARQQEQQGCWRGRRKP